MTAPDLTIDPNPAGVAALITRVHIKRTLVVGKTYHDARNAMKDLEAALGTAVARVKRANGAEEIALTTGGVIHAASLSGGSTRGQSADFIVATRQAWDDDQSRDTLGPLMVSGQQLAIL